MKNKCKNCNKEFEASTKINYCSYSCHCNLKKWKDATKQEQDKEALYHYNKLFSLGKMLTIDEIDNNRMKAYKPIV
jgi:hypothetical protein